MELVAIDDKNLYIYLFDKDGLRLKKEFKGDRSHPGITISQSVTSTETVFLRYT